MPCQFWPSFGSLPWPILSLSRELTLQFIDPLIGPVLRLGHFQPSVNIVFRRVCMTVPHWRHSRNNNIHQQLQERNQRISEQY